MPSSTVEPYLGHILKERETDCFPLGQSDLDNATTIADSVMTGMFADDEDEEE